MDHVIAGVVKFQNEVFPERAEAFRRLASGQSPQVLFITCSDSRIDPCLMTQTEPGDLFICRNAGNVVPPRTNQTGGMTASIEYAVGVLGVSHIIVCGHTDCGAMKGALAPHTLGELPHVREWLGHCSAATAVVRERRGSVGNQHLAEVTRENVLLQLTHLRTHPTVAAGLVTNRVALHGWLYDIGSGRVWCADEHSRRFVSVTERYGSGEAPREAVGQR